ncbi:MAG: VCBS repeat-containing protein [Fidelibacterota bacterium]|nr:MAG: VCBS repeat-containing protein [Candidatus Neomarinimicrobiota bacterium]
MLRTSKHTRLNMMTGFHNSFGFLRPFWTPTTSQSRIIIFGLALGLCLTSPVRAVPPTFVEVTAITDSLTGVSTSSAAWGDYDNDGDLDILLTGSYIAEVYRNDAGTFVDIEAGLTGVSSSSANWGDFDNDGDLDILITGYNNTTSTNIALVYRNNGDDTFTDIEAGLSGRTYSSAAWGDYDNDGDLDILSLGSGSGTIYRNDGGIFTDTDAFFSTYSYGKAAGAWGDYDNDGDLDVLVSNWSGGSKIYENVSGEFTALPATLIGVWDAAAAWGDYDNDGDLDVVLTGYTGSTRYTVLYENNEGAFSGHYVGTTGLADVEDAAIAWGDYDNDGDLDILFSGWTGLSTFARVYRNNGDDTFTDIATGLNNVSNGSASWGDYDNDGALDILLTGSGIAKVYENTSSVANNLPTAPTGLQSVVNQDTVTLSWNISTDTEPDAGGLSYNLRVGTTSGGVGLISPHANTTSGFRLIPALGNVQENLSWNLYDLPDGTIYWSVQSIDHALAGSAFAEEQTFDIAVPPAAPQNLAVKTYYDIGAAPLIWNQNTESDFLRYRIYMDTSPVPTTLVDSTSAIGDTTITITGLTVGTTYYFRIKAVDAGLLESVDFSNQDSLTVEQYSLKTDSLALVDLYNSTNGGTWTYNTDWLSGPVSSWYRVTVTDGRVAQVKLYGNNLSGSIPSSIGDLVELKILSLYGNNLSGTIPASIGNLDQLTGLRLEGNLLIGAVPDEIGNLTNLSYLYLNNNQLTAIPGSIEELDQLQDLYLNDNQLVDLPDLSSLQFLDNLRVQYNKLTFEDIEPLIGIGISGLQYAPQDSVGAAEDTTVEAGDSLTLSVSVGGTANTYQWIRSGQYLTGAIDSTLTLDPVSESDSGNYVCRIRNSIAGSLTLYSRPNHVTVSNTTAPAAPRNPAAEAGDGQVTLTWNQNTESDFLRYRIYSGTAAGPTTLVDSTGSITDTTRTLTGLTNDTAYYFRITAVDVALNESDYSSEVSATPTAPSAVSDQDALPTEFALHQNHPNPFNPATTLRFDLPEAGNVSILVYDLMGHNIARLVARRMEPGYHAVTWDGLDKAGRQVSAGVYIARMESARYTKTIKMLFLK